MMSGEAISHQSWEALRERLARANLATDGTFAPSPQHARELLEQRARRLAQPLSHSVAEREMLELVFFALAGEAYALETRYVREVLAARAITPIPRAPAFVLGACNLRGELLAVFDLRSAFALSAMNRTDLSRILVLGLTHAEFGIMTDEVQQVATAAADALTDSAASRLAVMNAYIRGVMADARVVLDGDALLSDPALSIIPPAQAAVSV